MKPAESWVTGCLRRRSPCGSLCEQRTEGAERLGPQHAPSRKLQAAAGRLVSDDAKGAARNQRRTPQSRCGGSTESSAGGRPAGWQERDLMPAQPIFVSDGGGLAGRRSAASHDVVRSGERAGRLGLAGPGVPLGETAGGLSQHRPCPTFSDRRFRWPPSLSEPDRNAGQAGWLDWPRILRSVGVGSVPSRHAGERWDGLLCRPARRLP